MENIKYRVSGNLDNTNLFMNNSFWLDVYPGLNKSHLYFVHSVIQDFINSKL